MNEPGLLRPAWALPAGVGASMSLRTGGASLPPCDSLNLGGAVQDDPAAVARNRSAFAAALGARPVWLPQVHGRAVRRLVPGAPPSDEPADAAWTTERGLACTVLVADCLPVLLAARDGRAVAAAHAGWRGLAGGVLEAAVQALCAGAGLTPEALTVWLGPCIGPRQFEVGADVLEAFGRDPRTSGRPDHLDPAFVVRPRPDGSVRWLADLPRLAAERLAAAGVPPPVIDGGCTVEDRSRFFSFRRDGRTGRMAAAIWLE